MQCGHNTSRFVTKCQRPAHTELQIITSLHPQWEYNQNWGYF